MFGFLSKKRDQRETKPAGPAFIVLNVLRTCNIISLLDVVVASWIMLVMTVKTSNFFFFDGVSHFITSTISIFLIVSELSLFKPYFTRNWPLLGPDSSFLMLGSAMVAVGFNILGNLNKEATSIQELGLPMWRVVISSGILSSVFGFITIFANYWYRTKTQTARQMRSRYVTEPELPINSYLRPLSLNGAHTSYNPSEPMTRREKFMSRLPFGNKRESRRFPVISGPMNGKAMHDYDEEKGSMRSREFERDEVLEDANELQRPPTALHPFHRRMASDENRYSASQYSVATHGPF